MYSLPSYAQLVCCTEPLGSWASFGLMTCQARPKTVPITASHQLSQSPESLQNDHDKHHFKIVYVARSVSLIIEKFPPLIEFYYPVSSVDQIEWPKKLLQNKPPNVYVEIQLEQSVLRTRVVKRSMTPTWDEELPM
jgi:hypothetical protein